MCINYFNTLIDTETKTRICTKTKDIYIDHTDLLAIYQDGIQGLTFEELNQLIQFYAFEELDVALLLFHEGIDYTDPHQYYEFTFRSPADFFRFVKVMLIYSEMSKTKR